MTKYVRQFCFSLFSKTKYVAGIAFQLVDDWLDFVSTAEQLGKFLPQR
jgi:geranylgeranyl pyrophosphate synthase